VYRSPCPLPTSCCCFDFPHHLLPHSSLAQRASAAFPHPPAAPRRATHQLPARATTIPCTKQVRVLLHHHHHFAIEAEEEGLYTHRHHSAVVKSHSIPDRWTVGYSWPVGRGASDTSVSEPKQPFASSQGSGWPQRHRPDIADCSTTAERNTEERHDDTLYRVIRNSSRTHAHNRPSIDRHNGAGYRAKSWFGCASLPVRAGSTSLLAQTTTSLHPSRRHRRADSESD